MEAEYFHHDESQYTSESGNESDCEIIPFDHEALDAAKKGAEANLEDDLDLEEEDYDGDVEESINLTSVPESSSLTTTIATERCVIIDTFDGVAGRCSQPGIRSLSNMIGTWEINPITETAQNVDISTLKICQAHYNVDRNKCHDQRAQRKVSLLDGDVNNRRCLFCNKNITVYSRGPACKDNNHLWSICGTTVQLPCIAFRMCRPFSHYPQVSNATEAASKIRAVCTSCFLANGGHMFEPKGQGVKMHHCTIGKGDHEEDTTQALLTFSDWIKGVAESSDCKAKEDLVLALMPSMKILKKDNVPGPEEVPSLFLVRTAMRIGKVAVEKTAMNLDPATCSEIGQKMALSLWNLRPTLKSNLGALENPSSLEEYWNAFPQILTEFFVGLLATLMNRKQTVVNKKRRQRGLPIKTADDSHVMKMACFLISMILTFAFRGWKIWLTTMMASLCGKPKLLSSLHSILKVACVISHTRQHERRLEKQRLLAAKPEERLRKGDHYWNLAIVDNIDFKEKTFAYGNIFDATRKSSHATLRMVFQFKLPISLDSAGENPPAMSSELFGTSPFTEQLVDQYFGVFKNFLGSGSHPDINDLNNEIKKLYPLGCRVDPPNVVILKPGPEPNSDSNVFLACGMYQSDMMSALGSNMLDISADEAIFRRIVKYKEQGKPVRPILGQWHTSKDMCAALIAAFSGYGIFNMAAELGVRFLDKLDAVVDYRATFLVLDLIWAAVGIAISRYLDQRNPTLTFDGILDSDNGPLKVWYLYFRWGVFWKGHKIGIRTGNFEMQLQNLSAFSPLFPVTGKFNYARSVAFFLANLYDEPSLRELLHHAASANLTKEGHYLGFDEALETFGVKFVKQNIGGDLTNPDNLMTQIQGVQSERERLEKLLSEFLDDPTVYGRDDRATKSRKDALWNLADKLVEAFSLPDPLTSQIFKNAKEMTPEGIQKILSCYETGKKRLESLLEQDVRKTKKRSVTGRRKKDLQRHRPNEKSIKTS